ncbi:uncharacterized protein [Nicotiana sylvestris]|uniref:uncharacterized protein n=1 Tax=Nicotiana sylvestris TaxID=4096 RepID=UPI00388CDF82
MDTSYNFLLGMPWIHTAGAMPSTLHQMVKFEHEYQEIVVHGEDEQSIYWYPSVPCLEAREGNNAANLNSHLMREICKQFKIIHRNSTPYRPKANGAVEAANKNIKKILRKMIQSSRQWHEKLPFALLGYQTTVRTSVRATPYLLVYGTEAVIPAGVEIPSLRIIVEAEIEDSE